MARIVLIAIFLVSFCPSCKKRKNTIFVSEAITLTGSFKLTSIPKFNPGQARAFIIDSNGARVYIKDFAMANDGSFRFRAPVAYIVEKLGQSSPIKIALMGHEFSGGASKYKFKHFGFIRGELTYGNDFDQNEGGIPYLQFLLPVSKDKINQATPSIEMTGAKGAGIDLHTVGKARVHILGGGGEPIAGAIVSSIPFQSDTPIRLDKNPLFMPVATWSDAKGWATVVPLPLIGIEPGYKVSVLASGYCPFVSKKFIYIPKEGATTHTFTLEECPKIDPKAGPKIKAAFGAGITVLPESAKDGEKLQRGYTKSHIVPLRITPQSENIRGLGIVVYEGQKPEGKVYATSQIPSFSSTIEVSIPRTYRGGQSENGPFVIGVRPLLTPSDQRLYGAFGYTYLYGYKSSVKPTFDPLDITITSSVLKQDIISGVAGNHFFVSYKNCREGAYLGLMLKGTEVKGSNTIFMPCQKSMRFEIDDRFGAIGSLGGVKDLKFVYRDIYTNLSKIAVKQVYLDFGVPKLNDQNNFIGLKLGFIEKNSPCLDTNSCEIARGLVINRNNVTEYVFKFASFNYCSLPGPSSPQDGIVGEKGLMIHSYQLVDRESIDEKPFVDCEKAHSITRGMINFPADNRQAASVDFMVQDLAGNRSAPYRYQIPPCTSKETTPHICWSE